SEVEMLASMRRRRDARAWARANAGPKGLAAMRAFQDTASEIALLRRRAEHGAHREGGLDQEHELLAELTRRRGEFIGMPVY
ncbi:MAG: protease PrsW, partial [Ornithinibacter sp.]